MDGNQERIASLASCPSFLKVLQVFVWITSHVLIEVPSTLAVGTEHVTWSYITNFHNPTPSNGTNSQ